MERSFRSPHTVSTRHGTIIAFSEAEAHAVRLNALHDDELRKAHCEIERQRSASMNAVKREIDWLRDRAEQLEASPTLSSPDLARSKGARRQAPAQQRSFLPSIDLSRSLVSQSSSSLTIPRSQVEEGARLVPGTNLLRMGQLARSTPSLHRHLSAPSYEDVQRPSIPKSATESSPRQRTKSLGRSLQLPKLTNSGVIVASYAAERTAAMRCESDLPSYASPATSRRRISGGEVTYQRPGGKENVIPIIIEPTDSPFLSQLANENALESDQVGGSSPEITTDVDGRCLKIVSVVGPVQPVPQFKPSSVLGQDSDEDDTYTAPVSELNGGRPVRKDWSTSSEIRREGISMEEAQKSTYVRLPPSISGKDSHRRLAESDAANLVFASD